MKVTRAKNVLPEHRVLVTKMVKECMRELAKKQYEIPATQRQLQDNCCVHIKRIDGQRSNFQKIGIYDGRRNKITINLHSYLDDDWVRYDRDKERYFQRSPYICEYKAFKDHPIIGSVRNCDLESVLRYTVAHEVAHYVQYEWGPKTRYLKDTYEQSHGKGFQTIYRYLRQAVVNPKIIKQQPRPVEYLYEIKGNELWSENKPSIKKWSLYQYWNFKDTGKRCETIYHIKGSNDRGELERLQQELVA